MKTCLSITPTRMRSINQTAILEYIRIKKTASKTELSDELSLSLPSVGRIVDDLVERQILCYTGKAEKGNIGRRRTLLEMDTENNIAVCVEVCEETINGGILSLGGEILQMISIQRGSNTTVKDLFRTVEELHKQANAMNKKYWGIAVVVPCVADRETGVIIDSDPEYFSNGYMLGDELKNTFHVPVIVENDSNAATLGELWYGNNSGIENMAVLQLRKGLGLGMIIDGVVYTGKSNAAGEIGNLVFSPAELENKVKGGYGPVEKNIAGIGLLEKAREKLEELKDPLGNHVTYDDLFMNYKMGRDWAVSIVQDLIEVLSMVMIVIHSMLDCEKIILSGEIIEKAPFLLEEIKSKIYEDIRVEQSEIGDFAGKAGGFVCLLQREMDYCIVKSLF